MWSILPVFRFQCLSRNGTRNLFVDRFINKLFINSIPAFDPTNSLYSVLETCGATLVMYQHARVTRELGPGNVNVISTTLEDAAREAVLSDHVYPRDAPVNILNR